MKKYSLIWWYRTGTIFRAEGYKANQRLARRLTHHIAYTLVFKYGKWIPAEGGDFKRINEVTN